MHTVAGPQHTLFASQVAKWDSDRLFEAQRAVEDLVEHPGWAVLGGLLADCKELVELELKYGRPSESQAEQAQIIGRLTGLESPQAAVEAISIKARKRQAQLETQEVE